MEITCQRCDNEADCYEMIFGLEAWLCHNCYNQSIKHLYEDQLYLEYRMVNHEIETIIDNNGIVKSENAELYTKLCKRRLFMERDLIDVMIKFINSA